MFGNGKKPLKIVFTNFNNLHMNKGKEHSNNSRTRDLLIRHIEMKQKEINQDIVIKMFDNLKGRVHVANENGLQSLMKF